MTVAVISGMIAPLVAPRLPGGIEVRSFASTEELLRQAPEAEIGWFDLDKTGPMVEAIRSAENLRWLNSIYAGMDWLPADLAIERGFTITNGAGINALTIAEYVVMLMLVHAKGFRDVMRAQDRHEWLLDSPGKIELAGSRALLLGLGAIGSLIQTRLEAFEVEVVPVRRSSQAGALRPDEWRARLGEFDWVILAVPATDETVAMIGADELAAMKDSAVIVNIARGAVIDQPALIEALEKKTVGGALLDVTTPEPLPEDHPLWEMPNTLVTMHLSGRAQSMMFTRSADRFVENCHRYVSGEPLAPIFDPRRGY